MKRKTKTIIFDLDGTLVDLRDYPRVSLLADVELLRRIKPFYQFAVVTGATTKEAIFALRETGLLNLFEKKLIITSDVVQDEKRSGLPFAELMKRIKGRAVVIGDSDSDKVGSEKAGLLFVRLEKGKFPDAIGRASKLLESL